MRRPSPSAGAEGTCQARSGLPQGGKCPDQQPSETAAVDGTHGAPAARPAGPDSTPLPPAGWTAWLQVLANHRGLRKFWLRVRAGAVLLVLGLSLPFLRQDWFWIGLVVAMAGELIQLWSFANMDKNSAICAHGPYALVRNPMYLGRYFVVAGLLLLYQSPYLILGMTVVYCIYAYNRVRREEALLTGIFQDSYRAYCRQVNRFLPALRPLSGSHVVAWNWRLLRRNNGLYNLLGLLAVFALAGWVVQRPPLWDYPW